jgi:hypothetical protein
MILKYISALTPRIEGISKLYYTKLQSMCPFIPFSRIDSETVMNMLISIDRVKKKEIDNLADEVLRKIAVIVIDEYKQAQVILVIKNAIPSEVGSKSFWENEERNRCTEANKNPSDWIERREVVFLRDNCQCQRCGMKVELHNCHIHHIERRSKGGNHSLFNLITVCRDCHALLEGHEILKGISAYYISQKTFHVPRCRFSRRATKIMSSAPRLMTNGLKPCGKCKPWEYHLHKIEAWNPSFSRKFYSLINEKFWI